jgi:hypothetical protein
MPVSFDILVEQHLLAGDFGVLIKDRRVPVARILDWTAALDTVLLAFEASSVVPPVTAADRYRKVGFFGACLDLVEDLLPQWLQMSGRLVGVGILGLKVRHDIGIGLVP